MSAREDEALLEADAPAPPLLPEATDYLLDVLDQVPQARLTPAFLERFKRRYTPQGRLIFLAFFLVGTAAASMGAYPIYFFAAALLSLSVVNAITGWIFRPRVSIERHLPERCAAGATVPVRAVVTNVGRLPLYDVCVTELTPAPRLRVSGPSPYAPYVAPGESVELAYALEPRRRGAYDFEGPVALTAFPFGTEHSERRVPGAHRLLVYPRFARLDALDLPVGRKHQPGGLQLVSEVGDTGEFVGTREYRAGDRIRDIHHKAWARLGTPVVREYQEEYLCRVALALDTYVPRGTEAERARLEAGISLGAAVAEVLSRQEYVIDIFAAGPDLYHFEAGRSLAYLDNILDVLACVDACPRNPFETLAPAIAAELERISTAVVVLLDWDETRLRFVRSLEDSGVATKVIVVHEGTPTSDPRGHVTTAGPVLLLTPAEIDSGVDRL